ncbi:tubby-related protein 4 [Plakobranchus ocellatus]|uniref:Tubby-related protein 4 n=1 Tax=Plakobranchus ocellatus TaxID=259542 RepID=A0AAV3Z6N6_9GAST|nr:tubby-related protein 4 [Plakobranchus ocellatus]
MIRHGEETSGGHYTLYLEYLGGLVPLLKGKRASKLRPDFVIFDPKIKSSSSGKEQSQHGSGGGGGGGSALAAIESDTSSESDSEVYMDGCGSPRMQRRRRTKIFRAEKVNRSITFRTLDELMYDDNLPETNRLVEVISNIWATKFQMTGVASCLPSCLGQVVYKTSLLRLQPRQMTVSIAEVTPSRHMLSRDPNFSPAPVSDEEDSSLYSEGEMAGERRTVEVTVHDANLNLMADVAQFPRESLGLELGRRCSTVDSPLVESSSPTMNGVELPLTAAAVPCIGGGGGVGVGVMAGKLGGSGTVRSRSLSPVRNSLTQTIPAFKQDSVGAGETISGDHQTLLLASTNGCGGGWQGARPKANNSQIISNSSNSNIILTPVVSSSSAVAGNGMLSNCNRRTSSTGTAVTALAYEGCKVNVSNTSSNSSSSSVRPAYTTCASNISEPNPLTNSHLKSGGAMCSNSNISNSKCSAFPTTPSPNSASSTYATPNSNSPYTLASCASRGEISPSPVTDTASSASKKQDLCVPELRQASPGTPLSGKTCFRGGLDLGTVPAQVHELDLKVILHANSCSNTSRPINTQHHEHSTSFGQASGRESARWADPAAEAVHLLLEDPALSVSHANQKEECGHKIPSSLPSLPHQSTLIADCSPTAPYSSDIHRRLYLAQHSFLPDSGAPISPSACPSCLPPHLGYREDILAGHGADFPSPRVSSLPHNAVSPSQLPGSVLQNNLKNSSPPQAYPPSRRSCHQNTGSPVQEAWSGSSPQAQVASDTTSALSATADGLSQRVQGLDKPWHLNQESCLDHAHAQQHSDSGPASSFISSYSSCLPSVLSNLLSFPGFSKDSKVSSAPDSETGAQQEDCEASPPATPHTACHQGHAADAKASHPERSLPSSSSSSDKLALILSEDPSTQFSSHNFRAMPGFVMRNPDLPEADDLLGDHNHSSQDMIRAAYNGFLSPPPSPPAVRHTNNHLSNDLDFQIQATSASLPSSPIRYGRHGPNAGETSAVQQELLKGRCKHLSPLLGRKGLPHSHSRSSSHSQDTLELEELRAGHQYESLEMFQKAQLRQKMRRRITSANGRMEQASMFTMHNKAPLWNETSQVYQLDFGGRVTQESAKNFQIELKGKQVMQFGRIDNHAYTLDFQYPFTAVQAFAVALANVTQRLK